MWKIMVPLIDNDDATNVCLYLQMIWNLIILFCMSRRQNFFFVRYHLYWFIFVHVRIQKMNRMMLLFLRIALGSFH